MARRYSERREPNRAQKIPETIVTQHIVTDLIRVDDLNDVPNFANEDEEAKFWGTHSLSERALDQMGPLDDDELPPPRERTRPVAIRFDDDVINRLKTVARLKHKGYQTLLKEFVVERLYEEEKRAGLVG
jgi:CopG antitoxin of type II toxin-antitoxin system